MKITKLLGANRNLHRSFPLDVSPSILKVFLAMVGKHMRSPGIPQFTRSVNMLDVGLHFLLGLQNLTFQDGVCNYFCALI